MVVPPKSAPRRVKAVIRAANRIRSKPYVWGGGHRRWRDRGYDCSGSVSFALHGGRFLKSPLPSGPLARWGTAGKGRWITVYANAGHTGPSWHRNLRSGAGYAVRHPAGY
jgi:hypothetical protein